MGYHLRIKICGITNEGDARLAALLGADAVGLNFAPESPRFIDRTTATGILRALPPFVDPVGVFVNQPLKEIYQFLQPVGRILNIQWHGQNRELANTYPYRLIAAFPVRDLQSLTEITRYLDMGRTLGKLPDALLLDGFAAGQHGGTGQRAPWELLADFRPGVPVILAGGLTPENVAEAIRVVQPYGVDVASGVESSPGVKSPEKLRRFLATARNAAYQLK
jgi:phosphoribosylanthranilate isomerase